MVGLPALMSGALSAKKDISKYVSAMNQVKTAYDVYSKYFAPESGFHSDMKNKEVGSASPFSKDARDATRANGAYLRGALGLTTGRKFNKNIETGTKRQQIASTAEHLIHQECIDLMLANVANLEEIFPDKMLGGNIAQIETHLKIISQLRYNKMMMINEACKLIQEYKQLGENPDASKSKELTDAVVKALVVIDRNETEINQRLTDLNLCYKIILTSMPSQEKLDTIELISLEQKKSISMLITLITQIKNIYGTRLDNVNKVIDVNGVVTTIIKLEHLEFYYAKKSIQSNPYIKFQLTTFIFRMNYDPFACMNFVLSLGSLGETFLTAINTRSLWYYHGFGNSKDYLPNSFHVLMKALGLTTEDFIFIKEKITNKDANTSEMKLTEAGLYLFEEIENSKTYTPQEKRALLRNLFGTIRQGESGDRSGMIARVQHECRKIDSAPMAKYMGKILDAQNVGLVYNARLLTQKTLVEIEGNSLSKTAALKDLYLERVQDLKNKLELFLNVDGNEIPEIKNNFKILFKVNIHDNINKRKQFEDLWDKFIIKLKIVYSLSAGVTKLLNEKVMDIPALHALEKNLYQSLLPLLDFLRSEKDALTDLPSWYNPILNFSYNFCTSASVIEYELEVNALARMGVTLAVPSGGADKLFRNICKEVTSTAKTVFNTVKRSVKDNKEAIFLKNLLTDHKSYEALLYFYNTFNSCDEAKKNALLQDDSELNKFVNDMAESFMSQSSEIVAALQKVIEKFKKLLIFMLKNNLFESMMSLCKIKLEMQDGTEHSLTACELKGVDFSAFLDCNFRENKALEKYLLDKKNILLKNVKSGFQPKLSLNEDDFYNLFIGKIDALVSSMEKLEKSSEFLRALFKSTADAPIAATIHLIREICDQFNFNDSITEKLIEYVKLQQEIDSMPEDGLNAEEVQRRKERLLEQRRAWIDKNETLNKLIIEIFTLNTDLLKEKQFSNQSNIRDTYTGVHGVVRNNLGYKFSGNYGLGDSISPQQNNFLYNMAVKITQFLIGVKIGGDVPEQFKSPEVREKLKKIAIVTQETMLVYSRYIRASFFYFNKITTQLGSTVKQSEDILKELFEKAEGKEENFSLEEENIDSLFQSAARVQTAVQNLAEQLSSNLAELANHAKQQTASSEIKQFTDAMFCSSEASEFAQIFMNTSRATTIAIEKDLDSGLIVRHIEDAHPYRRLLGKDFGEYLMFLNNLLIKADTNLSGVGSKEWEQLIQSCGELVSSFGSYMFSGPYIIGANMIEKMGFAAAINGKKADEAQPIKREAIVNEIVITKDKLIKFISECNGNLNFKYETIFEIIKSTYTSLRKKILDLIKEGINQNEIEFILEQLKIIDDVVIFNKELNQKLFIATKNYAEGNFQDHLKDVSNKLSKVFTLFNRYVETIKISMRNPENFIEIFSKFQQFQTDYSRQLETLEILRKNYVSKWAEFLKLNLASDHPILIKLKQLMIGDVTDLEHSLQDISLLHSTDRKALNSLIVFRFLNNNGLLTVFNEITSKLSTLSKKQDKSTDKTITLEEKREIVSLLKELQLKINVMSKRKYTFVSNWDSFILLTQTLKESLLSIFSDTATTKIDVSALLVKINAAYESMTKEAHGKIQDMFLSLETRVQKIEPEIENLLKLSTQIIVFYESQKKFKKIQTAYGKLHTLDGINSILCQQAIEKYTILLAGFKKIGELTVDNIEDIEDKFELIKFVNIQVRELEGLIENKDTFPVLKKSLSELTTIFTQNDTLSTYIQSICPNVSLQTYLNTLTLEKFLNLERLTTNSKIWISTTDQSIRLDVMGNAKYDNFIPLEISILDGKIKLVYNKFSIPNDMDLFTAAKNISQFGEAKSVYDKKIGSLKTTILGLNQKFKLGINFPKDILENWPSSNISVSEILLGEFPKETELVSVELDSQEGLINPRIDVRGILGAEQTFYLILGNNKETELELNLVENSSLVDISFEYGGKKLKIQTDVNKQSILKAVQSTIELENTRIEKENQNIHNIEIPPAKNSPDDLISQNADATHEKQLKEIKRYKFYNRIVANLLQKLGVHFEFEVDLRQKKTPEQTINDLNEYGIKLCKLFTQAIKMLAGDSKYELFLNGREIKNNIFTALYSLKNEKFENFSIRCSQNDGVIKMQHFYNELSLSLDQGIKFHSLNEKKNIIESTDLCLGDLIGGDKQQFSLEYIAQKMKVRFLCNELARNDLHSEDVISILDRYGFKPENFTTDTAIKFSVYKNSALLQLEFEAYGKKFILELNEDFTPLDNTKAINDFQNELALAKQSFLKKVNIQEQVANTVNNSLLELKDADLTSLLPVQIIVDSDMKLQRVINSNGDTIASGFPQFVSDLLSLDKGRKCCLIYDTAGNILGMLSFEKKTNKNFFASYKQFKVRTYGTKQEGFVISLQKFIEGAIRKEINSSTELHFTHKDKIDDSVNSLKTNLLTNTYTPGELIAQALLEPTKNEPTPELKIKNDLLNEEITIVLPNGSGEDVPTPLLLKNILAISLSGQDIVRYAPLNNSTTEEDKRRAFFKYIEKSFI